MPLAISCLGFEIWTSYSLNSWSGYLELRLAEKFAGILADSIRKDLAMRTFLRALKKRNEAME